MIVSKFGGSSVADSVQIKKVKAILESSERRTIVVVSAPGKRNKDDEKITDLLYQCNKDVQKGLSCKETFKKIQSRYIEIAVDLGIDTKDLIDQLDSVRRLIDAGYGADYAASRGEYLSAYLISKYLGWEFLDSAELIVINSDNTANPVSYENLRSRIEDGKKYVIPGFYGRDERSNVKTFSRGGSDITGSIVARAVAAELYENWTDVSGVYSANPTIVNNAKPIAYLSYQEVRELAEVGASVFHEEAIAPVVEVGIPINVKNTNRPDDPGTIISSESNGSGVSGISAKGGLSMIRLRRLMLFKKSGMRHALLTMLHIFGIRPCYSLFGIDSIVWYFESKMASDSVCDSMCERVKDEYNLDSVTVTRGYAIMALVGPDMNKSTEYIDALIALKEAGIEVATINYGASETSTLIAIKEEDKDEAVRVVYKRLFG